MAERPHFERGRRLYSIGHGHTNARGDRRRTAAAVRGDDAGERRPRPDYAAAVLYPPADQAWRSAPMGRRERRRRAGEPVAHSGGASIVGGSSKPKIAELTPEIAQELC